MHQREECRDIILAVDGSEHSSAALNLIADIKLGEQCLVTALSVLDTPHTPRRQILLAALEHSRKQLTEKNITVKTGILHGHPAGALIEYADEHEPDIIVFGAKGRRATLGILLGGVAQQLVEHARWPILVVRSPYEGIRNILIVTDGSEHSQQALKIFLKMRMKTTPEIHLAHVVPPVASLDPEIIAQTWPMGAEIIQPVTPEMSMEYDKYMEEEEQKGEQTLDTAVDYLEKYGIQANKVLLRGDVATEILQYARDIHADLIIAGSRGLSRVQGWLLGSVSRKLVHYAMCSVLIAK